jgi:hypothetical protein
MSSTANADLAAVVARVRRDCGQMDEHSAQYGRPVYPRINPSDALALCDAAEAAARLGEQLRRRESEAASYGEQIHALNRIAATAERERDEAREECERHRERVERLLASTANAQTLRSLAEAECERLRGALKMLAVVDDPAECFQQPTLRGIAKVAKDALRSQREGGQ